MSNPQALKHLVLAGAALYVFLRGAKFALFKPAEEMVYIQLDRESKTTGKAAIDVVGAQVGKTGGSLLQQGLLILLVRFGMLHAFEWIVLPEALLIS